MNLQDAQSVLQARGEPPFRFRQVKRAFYVELLHGWDELTTFSKDLRLALAQEVPWTSLASVTTVQSRRGDTVKTLFKTVDGKNIETVLMRHEGGRNTVCVSSQIGCAMACSFCATGTMGFKRNLSAEEIVDQIMFFARWLKPHEAHITNVVFMGMGEPMNNYDEVLRAIRILNDHGGFDLGARHITLSTCGIVPGIMKLAKENLQINLAISLHSALEETRGAIMPVNRPYPLSKLMDAVDEYSLTTNRKVFFEYLMLGGINDSSRDAEALVRLLEHNKRLYHVNLIKYHDTALYRSTPTDERHAFLGRLKDAGISVTHRVSFGEDIDAACGQLAVREEAGELTRGLEAARKNRTQKHAKAKV